MAATYVTAAGLERLARDLTDRDGAVLDSLNRLRLATTAQLGALHFSGGATAEADARACRRTLARLRNARLVHPLDRRVGGVRAGSAGITWALGVAGQRLLARGGVPRRPWTPSPDFIDHRLAITQLYVDLMTTSGPGRVHRFEAEPDSWRRYPAAGGGRVWIKPDAFLMVRSTDYDQVDYLECDLATESPVVIARKAVAYRQHLQSGQGQREHDGIYPFVTFTVPTEQRRRVIEKALDRYATSHPHLFRVLLASDAARVLLGGES